MAAAASYYNAHQLSPHEQQQQHLLSPTLSSPGMQSGQSSPSTPWKPTHGVRHSHRTSLVDFEGIQKAHTEDVALKAKIRRLRVYSRLLGFAISVAVFIPITMTLQKFLTTQNVYRDVTTADGTTHSRTAWAKNSKVWPTWMYFLVAGISVLLNFAILVSYMCGGVKKANNAAVVATAFTWLVLLGNLIVWCVAASLYRTEKDKNGKSNDLWGWTCSPAAKAIQKEFAKEVDFNRYCNVQSVSFYIGLAQVGAAILTLVTYIYVFMRRRTKKTIKRHSQMAGQYPSNY